MPTDDSAFHFTMQPCGQNFFATVVKTVCEKATIQGNSNHSLHATGATRLFAANIPEKLIQERTGHCSTTARGGTYVTNIPRDFVHTNVHHRGCVPTEVLC